jgi:DNA-binding XRE family transcriptional regulator
VANVTLKMAMLQAELSNKKLADKVGVHPTNMSAIANGRTPHLHTAQKIVQVLNDTGKVQVTIDGLWPLKDN